MITLLILSTLYTIIAGLIHYKMYKDMNIFEYDPKLWTIVFVCTFTYSLTFGIIMITKHCP